MDLATAIREGCKIIPRQSRGLWFDSRTENIDSACVMGSAAIALFGPKFFSPSSGQWRKQILEAFPEAGAMSLCPACLPSFRQYNRQDNVCGIAIHLNDRHEWTRERIADWIESI